MVEMRLPSLALGQAGVLRQEYLFLLANPSKSCVDLAGVLDRDQVDAELALGGRFRGIYVDWSDDRFTSLAVPTATSETLRRIEKDIRALATRHGFPKPAGTDGNREFDWGLVAILGDSLRGAPLGQLWLAETWQLFSFLLLPDVTEWRFPGNLASSGSHSGERWSTLFRHVFGRLWWRDFVLGRESATRIGEDQATSLLERPALTGNADLARAICEGILNGLAAASYEPDQQTFRCVSANLLRLGATRSLDSLSPDARGQLIAALVEEHLRHRGNCPF